MCEPFNGDSSGPYTKIASEIHFLPPIFLYGLTAKALDLVIKNIDKTVKCKITNLSVDRLKVGLNCLNSHRRLFQLIKASKLGGHSFTIKVGFIVRGISPHEYTSNDMATEIKK